MWSKSEVWSHAENFKSREVLGFKQKWLLMTEAIDIAFESRLIRPELRPSYEEGSERFEAKMDDVLKEILNLSWRRAKGPRDELMETIEAFREEAIEFDDFILELKNQTIDAIGRARAGVEVVSQLLSEDVDLVNECVRDCRGKWGGATTNDECTFEKAEAIRSATEGDAKSIAMLAAELVREGVVFDSQDELDEQMTLYERLGQLKFILIQGLDGENYRKFGNAPEDFELSSSAGAKMLADHVVGFAPITDRGDGRQHGQVVVGFKTERNIIEQEIHARNLALLGSRLTEGALYYDDTDYLWRQLRLYEKLSSVAFAVVYPSKNNGSYEVGEAVERLEFSSGTSVMKREGRIVAAERIQAEGELIGQFVVGIKIRNFK